MKEGRNGTAMRTGNMILGGKHNGGAGGIRAGDLESLNGSG